MNPCIVSFYMSNIHPLTVDYQRRVVDKFNVSKVPHYQIQTQMRHGTSMDMFWCANGVEIENGIKPEGFNIDHDVVMFLDIDCVPLKEMSIDFYLKEADAGRLIGSVQRSNHIENDQHLFAAPSCLAIRRDVFQNMGAPTASETFRSDVAEEYTFFAEENRVPVELIMPLKFDEAPSECPSWALKDGMQHYGRGTTFGDHLFWHSFQIFHPGQQEKFHAKCKQLLGE